jgi:hypothetical protein
MDRSRIYQAVGEASHIAQVLEVSISGLIAITNQEWGAEIDESAIVIADDRKTLGRLFDELKKRVTICENTVRALSDALDARNWIAHHFFVRNTAAFEDESAFELALSEINKRTKKIAIATVVVDGISRGLCKALALNRTRILVREDG